MGEKCCNFCSIYIHFISLSEVQEASVESSHFLTFLHTIFPSLQFYVVKSLKPKATIYSPKSKQKVLPSSTLGPSYLRNPLAYHHLRLYGVKWEKKANHSGPKRFEVSVSDPPDWSTLSSYSTGSILGESHLKRSLLSHLLLSSLPHVHLYDHLHTSPPSVNI